MIERCLAKEPAARFQTAADVEAALQGKPEAESGRMVEHLSGDLSKPGSRSASLIQSRSWCCRSPI